MSTMAQAIKRLAKRESMAENILTITQIKKLVNKNP